MKIDVLGQKLEIEESRIENPEKEIREQLSEYLSGDRKSFDLSIFFPDSFTGTVMQEISKIEYGDTKTYGEIAEEIDSSPVAVGQACGRNPIPIIVPCHRVTGKNSTGGYIGGLEMKQKLLKLEQ